MSNEGECSTGPRHLITEEALSAALKADKGENAHLRSWQVKDFVKKGTNYMCYVTSVVLRYMATSEQGDEEVASTEEKEVTYVLKVNPCRDVKENNSVMALYFHKEEGFYMNIVPRLNSVMEQAGLPKLNFPTCYYSCKDEGKQMMIMEDLRHRGFNVADHSLAMEESHRMLVLRHLARFHASSLLFNKKHPEEDLEKWVNTDEYHTQENVDWMDDLFGKGFDVCYIVAKQTDGYEKARKWLEKNKESPTSPLVKLHLERSKQFYVLNHGDLNPNNLLYRYNSEGNPVDVMFVDLQGTGFRSPVGDLHSHFYMGTPGPARRQNKAKYLSVYYEAFKSVLDAVDEEMPFTLEELSEELKRRLPFGFVLVMVGFQFIFDPKDVDDFLGPRSNIDQDKLAKKIARLIDTRKGLFDEVYRVFEEMDEGGVFDE